MATITATATPVIKYSDTTDITLLLPADIAKFTEKDFALFTTQQQSDLSAAQVAPLTAKQIAALPLKLVEPDTIAAMTTAAVASFDLKSFTPDQFSALTSLQFKVLTTAQISVLTPAQVDLISLNQAAVLTADQLAAFSLKNVAMLNASIIEVLPTAAMTGFTTANIIGLTTDAIAALTTAQASTLTAKQIATLTPSLVSNLEAEDIAALSTNAVRGFSKVNISALDLSALSSDQFGALSSKQLGLLTTTQLETLTAESAPLLTSKSIAALTSAQLAILSTDIISALDPIAIKGFSVKNIVGLTTNQIAAINPEQSTILSKVQLKALLSSQVSALTVDSILAIKPIILKGLSSTLMQNFNPSVFASLTEVQIGSLTGAHIAGLTTAQTAGLTGAQLELIKAPVLASLTPANVSAISVDSVSALTTTQLGKFSTTSGGQLESLTPAQAAQLSSTVKDWVVAKNFALIQSSQTTNTVTTPSGIETSGTITGAARAETIISGAGNDIISTGSTTSTTGDSIDSGAGNDTITMTNATTGHRHSIAGGTGTDTLILAGAANYTSGDFAHISGIEKITLTVDATQTLDLGAGVTNAITTVTATALATDEKSLTLSGSANGVTVTISNANLSAPTYTGSLTIDASSSTTGTNVITTGSGADSINAGSGVDVITAGSGLDTMTGGAGADTFIFAAGANGAAPSASVFDTITDFISGEDIIDFDTALTISATSTLTTGTAKILPTGEAKFAEADDTLQERIVATEAALSPTAGKSAIFKSGTDSYVFVSDATDGISSTDTLIKLSGLGATSLGIKDGNIASVQAKTIAEFTTSLGGSASSSWTEAETIYVVDTATAIQGAAANLASNAGKIDALVADSGVIVLSPTNFSGLASKLAPNAATVDVTTALNATTDAEVIVSLVTYVDKIATGGLTKSGVGVLPLSPAQFATSGVVAALADGTVSVEADGSNVSTLVSNAGKIASGKLTGTISLTAEQFATAGVATALNTSVTKITATNTDTASQKQSLVDNYTKIATGGISGTGLTFSDTQFATLQPKFANAATASVIVDATNATTAELTAMATGVANISAITGSSIIMTAERFDTLHSLLSATGNAGGQVTVTVNATGATTPFLSTVAAQAATKVAAVTNLTLTSAQSSTEIGTLLGKAGVLGVNVNAASMNASQITALAAGNTKIATNGITSASALTIPASEFVTLLSKFNGNDAVLVDFSNLDGTGAGSATVNSVIASLATVNKIAGTSITLTPAQFISLHSELDTGVTVTINANGANNTQLTQISAQISKVSAITNLTLALGTDVNSAGNTAANNTITNNLLSKAVAATVDPTNATADEITSLFTYINNVGNFGSLGASFVVTAAQFESLNSSMPTGGVVVNASGASNTQLGIIAANIDKVASITNLTLTHGNQTTAQTATLLDKAANGTVNATITGATGDVQYISTLVQYANKFATGTGSTGINASALTLTDDQFTALATKFDTAITNIVIDATNATSAELTAISTNNGRVGLINNLVITAATQSDTETANLLSKAATGSAIVNADGASSTEMGSLVTHLANINTNGINATQAGLTLTSDQFVALESKINGTVTVNASGATTGQLTTLSTSGSKATALTNLTLTHNQSATEMAALLAKTSNDTVSVNATSLNASQIGELVTNYQKLASGGITAPASLSINAAQFASLGSKLASGVGAVVDAQDALVANLVAVSNNIARVNEIRDLTLATADASMTEGVTANLLSKATTGTAIVTVDGTTTVAEISSLSTYAAKIANAGISGALTLTAESFSTLHSKLGMAADTGNTFNVNATNATAGQLTTLNSYRNKVDSIANLTITANAQTDAETANLLALADATSAQVVATGATTAEVASMVANSGKIAANGISGTLAITSAVNGTSGADITTLFGKYSGTTATVNTTGMDTAQLIAVSGVTTKIASSGITNLSVATDALSDTQTANLLGKAADALVNATTSVSTAELQAISTNIANIAAGGISNLTLPTASLTDAETTNLLSKVATATPSTVIDATSASATELTAVSNKIATVTSITNLTVTAATQSDAETENLLNKAAATTANVVATGATTTEVASIVARAANIAAGGITGTISLNFAQWTAGVIAGMSDAGATVTIADDTLTAANVVTLAADAKVDAIRVAALTLSKAQYATANLAGKLSVSDAITVNDATLTAADINTLGSDPKVDYIRAATQSLDVSQFTAAAAKLSTADTITVTDTSAILTAALTSLVAGVVDTIDVTTADGDDLNVTSTQFTTLVNGSATMATGDTVVVTSGAGANTFDLNATKLGTAAVQVKFTAFPQAGDSVSNFTTGTDKIALQESTFGSTAAWTAHALTSTAAAATNTYFAVTAAPNGTPVDLNDTTGATTAGIVAVGATTGTGGVDIYYTTNLGAFETANSTLLVTLTGLNTGDVAAADFVGF